MLSHTPYVSTKILVLFQ